jgi:hypothetical protein
VIHRDPIEPQNDPSWERWRVRARAATHALVTNPPDPIVINDDLYKEGRDAILKLFFGKCAYCESQITADQWRGDVDHFRPKKRVTDENGEVVRVGQNPHPGYFWLAYEWTNLLPACASCNRPGTDSDGSRGGKWDRFPIEGTRAVRPGDSLSSEDALLIDPYMDEPSDHLAFDPATGLVAGKTKKGTRTIEILKLNREGLLGLRKRIAKGAGDDYRECVNALMRGDQEEFVSRRDAYVAHEEGAVPYSAFGREAIRQIRERLCAADLIRVDDGQ